MSPNVQSFVMLLIWKVYLSSSGTIYCDLGYNCAGQPIQCEPAGEACNVICKDISMCDGASVACPDNYPCTISCDGLYACQDIHIDAKSSSELILECNGVDACSNIIVYCPPNNAGTKKCIITAHDDNLNGGGSTQSLEFYAVYGWNDLDITDQSSASVPMGNIRDQTMYCTANYSESCRIPADWSWTCENTWDICNDPPIPTTTLDPTTIPPTSSSPTTAVPTTSIPTTTNPTISATTNNPTTSFPTTSNPTTSIPTTTNPTTSATTNNPTTSNPTTSVPTTSIPTTTNPTTSAITNTPTTSVPTANIPTSSTNATPATANPTNRPSTYPSYIPTISPGNDGKITEQLTTDDSEDAKESSADSYYILVIGLVILFMIISCVSVFVWKRKKSAKQYKADASNVGTNNVSNNKDIDIYETVMDKSPNSVINGAVFLNNSNSKEVENMDEIQLTPTCYKEGNNGNNDNNDADNDDVEEMYTNVITDDGNIVTKKGETAKGEHNLDINNVMYIMEDMEGNLNIDDIHDKETKNKVTVGDTVTNGNV